MPNFKKVNDKYGHLIGDKILKEVANRIKNSIRKSDVVGRYGGEEFIVYVNNMDEDGIKNVAEKIRNAVSITPINEIEETMLNS